MKENQQKQVFSSPTLKMFTFRTWQTVICASFSGIVADDVEQVDPEDYVSF